MDLAGCRQSSDGPRRMAPLRPVQQIAAHPARAAGQRSDLGCLFWLCAGWLESLISQMYGEAVPRRQKTRFQFQLGTGKVRPAIRRRSRVAGFSG
jgi:hypothetical protein